MIWGGSGGGGGVMELGTEDTGVPKALKRTDDGDHGARGQGRFGAVDCDGDGDDDDDDRPDFQTKNETWVVFSS